MAETVSVFVSFCLDDFPTDTEETGKFHRDNWIEGFVKTLHYLFIQTTDFEDIEIVDSRTVESPEKAKECIAKFDIFLIIYSANYCYQTQPFEELKYFEGQKDTGEESIIILPQRIPDQEIPFYLKKYTFYRFFYEDKEIDMITEYRSNDKIVSSGYLSILRDLICDIEILIDKKNGKYFSNGKVYLANTSFDMISQYQQIRRLLISANYEVVPRGDIPLRYSSIKRIIASHLSECNFSIHIVGSYFGDTIAHSKQSLVSIQILIAEALCEKGQLTTLVWYPFHISAKESRQRSFLEFLGMMLSGKKNIVFMRSNIEELKTKIKSVLFEEENKGFEIQYIYPEKSAMIIYKGAKYAPLSEKLRNRLRKNDYHTYAFQIDKVVMASWENVCYRIFNGRILIIIAETDQQQWIENLMNLVKKRSAVRRKKEELAKGQNLLILESIFSKELLSIKGFEYTLLIPGQENAAAQDAFKKLKRKGAEIIH